MLKNLNEYEKNYQIHFSERTDNAVIYGMDYLKRKLYEKERRVRLRYRYYEMKQGLQDISGLIPPEFNWLHVVSGWCAKAVDSLADRVVPYGFDDDVLQMDEIYKLNNSDVLFDSAVLSALISSCSFIYIGADTGGYPTMQVIDGRSATGIIDPVTGMLQEGYAVLERDQNDKPTLEAYFSPNLTEYYSGGRLVESFNHKAPFALLVPVIYRPDAARPFGHSRISRACMELTQAAMRTLRRSEVAAEFYSVPQKYVLGLSEDAEFNGRAAMLSNFLVFTKDEDNDKPTLGQFSQQSTQPFTDQLRTLAGLFAGETGLTMDDLGFTTDNPSSSEAIRAAHESLRLTARKAQRTFGVGLKNAGYLAACVRDDYGYTRNVTADTNVLWCPIFEPDTAALGGLGDAVLKINQAAEGFIGDKNLRELTGLERG